MDKKLFQSDTVIALKNPEKPFPIGSEVGVLKWRYQSTDESSVPLTSQYGVQDLLIRKNALDMTVFAVQRLVGCVVALCVPTHVHQLA